MLVGAHGGVADGAGPDRCDEGADIEAFALDQVGDALEFVVTGLGIGVRQEEEVIDPVKLLAIDLGGGGQFKHALERDGWFLAFLVALADESGPHCVMKFWCWVAGHD